MPAASTISGSGRKRSAAVACQVHGTTVSLNTGSSSPRSKSVPNASNAIPSTSTSGSSTRAIAYEPGHGRSRGAQEHVAVGGHDGDHGLPAAPARPPLRRGGPWRRDGGPDDGVPARAAGRERGGDRGGSRGRRRDGVHDGEGLVAARDHLLHDRAQLRRGRRT